MGSRLFPTPANADLIRSIIAGKNMLDKTQIGQNLNNMAQGVGNAAMAGITAAVAAPGMAADALSAMNEQQRQEYNREQSRRARGAGSGANGFAGRETPDQYNQRLIDEALGLRPPTALTPPVPPPPPKPRPFAGAWDRSPTGPTGYDS